MAPRGAAGVYIVTVALLKKKQAFGIGGDEL